MARPRTIINGVLVPTLTEIRAHIRKHAWNGREILPHYSHEKLFVGMCEYASTAISEMLTGTGLGFGGGDWSLRVRGWYKGELTACLDLSGCDSHAFDATEPKHCHSWVEFGGKIIDPTWWQFTGAPVRVYVFDIDDPRFVKDEKA